MEKRGSSRGSSRRIGIPDEEDTIPGHWTYWTCGDRRRRRVTGSWRALCWGPGSVLPTAAPTVPRVHAYLAASQRQGREKGLASAARGGRASWVGRRPGRALGSQEPVCAACACRGAPRTPRREAGGEQPGRDLLS